MDKRKFDYITTPQAYVEYASGRTGGLVLSKRDMGALEKAWERSYHYSAPAADIQLDEKRIKEKLKELQEMMKRIDHETAKTERALVLDVWFPYAA